MTPEEITRQAAKLREKNEQLAEKARLLREKKQEEEEKAAERIKNRVFLQSDSYLTYRYLFVNATFLYLFGLLVVGGGLFCYFIIIPSGIMENAELYLLMAWASWFIVSEIFIFILYLRYKDWRTRLPFEVEGWVKMVNREYFSNEHFWRKATVQVKLAQNTPPDFMNDLLYLFCDKAYRKYYYSEDGAMEQWTIEGTNLNGAINRKVAAVLYRFIHQHLLKLHQNRDIQIEKVIIWTSKDADYFSVPMSD